MFRDEKHATPPVMSFTQPCIDYAHALLVPAGDVNLLVCVAFGAVIVAIVVAQAGLAENACIA